MALGRRGAVGSRTVGDISRRDEVGGDITDTDILQKPIDCVLAGQHLIKDRFREAEIRAPMTRLKTVMSAGLRARLRGPVPSFSVTTNKRGYD